MCQEHPGNLCDREAPPLDEADVEEEWLSFYKYPLVLLLKTTAVTLNRCPQFSRKESRCEMIP